MDGLADRGLQHFETAIKELSLPVKNPLITYLFNYLNSKLIDHFTIKDGHLNRRPAAGKTSIIYSELQNFEDKRRKRNYRTRSRSNDFQAEPYH